MVGESSTTRKFAFSIPKIKPLTRGGEQIEEALDRVQLPFGLRIELRRENRRRGMRGKQREELVVDGRERILLLQQLVNRDEPDDVLFDLQRHGGERLVDGDRAAVGVDVLI